MVITKKELLNGITLSLDKIGSDRHQVSPPSLWVSLGQLLGLQGRMLSKCEVNALLF